ncbi:MAG: helix-turn-helix domain-containing protein [Candidatus Omnitrophica bacterium]|nr:helix-turn-helix domain-containing protein [Candidatus Omnitrophota bacterium]MBU4035651.1 helix-turn-helix domain-containing protein [Pseudomonadota bacterium]MBU4149260.1 helix-turn-helix domain-containing protein [Candidatus Omnitrophota bacterium]
MKKVQEHINEKLKNDPGFKERHSLMLQKLEVGKQIIGYRIKHNLTQKQLADELGITQQYISKIEEGNFSTLDAVGHVLFQMGYRLILKVEPNKAIPESAYTSTEWGKIEKIVAEKGKTYKTAKRAKKHIQSL